MHVPPEARRALNDKIKDHIWTASVNSDGYPKVKIDGKSHLATHVLLETLGRPVPKGKVVMHKDNNPRNLDPSNLVIGTQQQNLKQMRDEGRDRPRGVPQEPDVQHKKIAFYYPRNLLGFLKWAGGGEGFIDSIDQAASVAKLQDYHNLPPQTRHLVDSLGKQYGMPGSGAYQTLSHDATYRGARNFDALVQMHARNAGIRRNPALDIAPEIPQEHLREWRESPPPLPPPRPAPPPPPVVPAQQATPPPKVPVVPAAPPPPPRPPRKFERPTPLGNDVLFEIAGPPRPNQIPKAPFVAPAKPATSTLSSALARSPLGIPRRMLPWTTYCSASRSVPL